MISVKFNGELRSVSIREFTKRDGSKGYSYPIMIETTDTSYTLNTTVDVYNAFVHGQLVKGQKCEFMADYEPRFQYNNFNIKEVKVLNDK